MTVTAAQAADRPLVDIQVDTTTSTPMAGSVLANALARVEAAAEQPAELVVAAFNNYV